MVYPRRMHKQGGTRLKNVRSHTEGLQGYASLYEAIYLLTALISPWFHKVVSVVAGRGGGERGGGGGSCKSRWCCGCCGDDDAEAEVLCTHTHSQTRSTGWLLRQLTGRTSGNRASAGRCANLTAAKVPRCTE